MSVSDLAQYKFVQQYIDWKVVKTHLKQYPAIGRTFSLQLLESKKNTSPYFCHYMSWRLGNWKDEALFAHLDKLICVAESIPGWKYQSSLLTSADFAEFWSWIWQLQVAEFLGRIGSGLCWRKRGPDLSVNIDDVTWFVECYAYRKSFGLMLFLEEALKKIDSRIYLYYDKCLPLSLLKNDSQSEYLDRVLSPFQDPNFVVRARIQAEEKWPVILRKDKDSSLIVYIEGEDEDKYTPGILPNQTGDTQKYLEVALREAIKSKNDANNLKDKHPNLLAINYALSIDYQMAINLADDLDLPSPSIELGANIDIVAVSTLGIDKLLCREGIKQIPHNNSGLKKNKPPFIS